jgi:Na+-translocating ferredoxin:NAD+ oxidoreductase RnfC subunit
VEFMIANGAECEPLIHKDVELMKHFPGEILAGMGSMMDSTGARQGKFGIKSKNAESLEALQHSLKNRLAVDADLARGGAIQPADQIEERRLPGSRGPDDGDHLAARDLEIDGFERSDLALAVVDLGNTCQRNHSVLR